MKLTPLDIKKQEFKKVLRGYDSVEVDAFLDTLSSEFSDLLRQVKEMREQAIENEVQLRDYKQKERDLQQVLMQAQENSARTIDNARKEGGTDHSGIRIEGKSDRRSCADGSDESEGRSDESAREERSTGEPAESAAQFRSGVDQSAGS
jgi:cell division initiation protein